MTCPVSGVKCHVPCKNILGLGLNIGRGPKSVRLAREASSNSTAMSVVRGERRRREEIREEKGRDEK